MHKIKLQLAPLPKLQKCITGMCARSSSASKPQSFKKKRFFCGDERSKKSILQQCSRKLKERSAHVSARTRPLIMCIRGPHGCGKTFLVNRIAEECLRHGVRVVGHDELASLGATAAQKTKNKKCLKKISVDVQDLHNAAILVDDAEDLVLGGGVDTGGSRALRNVVQPLLCSKPAKNAASVRGARRQTPLLVVLVVHDTHTLAKPLQWLKRLPMRWLRAPHLNQLVPFAVKAHLDMPNSMRQVQCAAKASKGDLRQFQLLLQMAGANAAAPTDEPPDMFREALELMWSERPVQGPRSLSRSGVMSLVHSNTIDAFGSCIEEYECVADRMSLANALQDDRVFGCAGTTPSITKVNWNLRAKTRGHESSMNTNGDVIRSAWPFFVELVHHFSKHTSFSDDEDDADESFTLPPRSLEADTLTHLATTMKPLIEKLTMDDRQFLLDRVGKGVQWFKKLCTILDYFCLFEFMDDQSPPTTVVANPSTTTPQQKRKRKNCVSTLKSQQKMGKRRRPPKTPSNMS